MVGNLGRQNGSRYRARTIVRRGLIPGRTAGPLVSLVNASAVTAVPKEPPMSLNPDATQERIRGTRAALWLLAGPWWLLLLTGIGC
jgi:hypothetical protein